jgi:hypothetical protein
MIAHLLHQLAWEMLSMDDIKDICPMFFGEKCPEVIDKETLLQMFCLELVDEIVGGK